jgi:hypothetical protein
MVRVIPAFSARSHHQPYRFYISQRNRRHYVSYALHSLGFMIFLQSCYGIWAIARCNMRALSPPALPPNPPTLTPPSGHYLLVCVLIHLQRHLSRQTISVVRNQMRSLWFGDKEAHGDVRGLVLFRNRCCCAISLQLSPNPHAAENFDVLEKLLSNDAEHSPVTILGFEATCVCCVRLSLKF